MSATLQVIYPTDAGTKFDYDYYTDTHMKLVQEHMGEYLQSALVTKGLSGGPDQPAGFYAIATLVFADQDKLKAALRNGAPVVGDIPNFTDVQPQMLFGEEI